MLNFNNIRPNNRRISYAYLPRGKLYEYLGDGLNIQIHSKKQRFIKRIKEAYEKLKENTIGIRLVEDIRELRTRQEDQYGFYKEDLKDKPPSEVIPLQKFISDPCELDITLFHEMNHYRHYLQVGSNVYNEHQEWYSVSQTDKYNTMMVSDEELLQLTGCLHEKKDNIYEMLYRANRLNTPVRYPYSNDEPNEYVKSIATAGYFSDLLTPN